jgi:hypothetical protein
MRPAVHMPFPAMTMAGPRFSLMAMDSAVFSLYRRPGRLNGLCPPFTMAMVSSS